MSEQRVPTKDELIVRQSQMERAIEIYSLIGEKPSLREICRLSKLLTEFIFTWDENNENLKKFDKHFELPTKDELNALLMEVIGSQLETKK